MSMDWSAGLWLMVGFAAGWGGNRWRAGRQPGSSVGNLTAAPARLSKLSAPDQETLQRTQLAYQLAHEMAQFQAGFLARTSHELRSPLNGVIGLHQLILADLCDDPAEEREFVQQAHESAKKLLALLDEATGVSKLEHGTAQIYWEATSLADLLNEVKTLTHLQARNRNLRLEISLPDPALCVWSDRRWLRQVLVNLIITPVYLMEEGTIRLTTQLDVETQQVHVIVEDQRPAAVWRESGDLLQSGAREYVMDSDQLLIQPEAIAPDALLGKWEQQSLPGLKLMVSQRLVQHLGGRLTLEAVPTCEPDSSTQDEDEASWTRIRCSLPLAIATDDEPETAR
ncbi:MAG: sensor histidine kinase [Elainellaceae cyanobacterium]